MYDRVLAKTILSESAQYSVLALTGPRQSGKTTLARHLFPNYQYLLLEDLELKNTAQADPKGFLNRYPGSLIIDEAQKVPELFSYIQGIVDEPHNKRQFILTGSEHLQLSDQISQTLAGRVRIYHLLPLSRKELALDSIHETLLYGGYPRIKNQDLSPTTWLSQYYATYVQKDVRSILKVGDLDQFDRLVRLAASRVGQLLDYASIANDCGISQPTAKAWFSVLKTTFICFSLEPHFKNFGKRIIKSPKPYFFDVGLLCYLLRIKNTDELISHPQYGSIFENWVISEKIKALFNQGQESSYYFWRDQKGHEVDLIEDRGAELYPIEIKSSQTFHPDFLKNLSYLNGLQGTDVGECIYGGSESYEFLGKRVTSWKNV